MQRLLCAAGIALATAGYAAAQAQADPGARSQALGETIAVDAAARRITIKTDAGQAVTLSVRENAPILRVPPGSKDLKTAAKISLAEIAAGDRVAATVRQSAAGAEAGSLVVMTGADLAQRRRNEQEDWRRRGSGGIVSALDPANRSFTMKQGPRSVTVRSNDGTDFRRYAPDSVKFSDARLSSFADLREGDQVRVLGDRDGGGATIAAERIVSGSFRQIAGTIAAIDAETKEIRVVDLAARKPLKVRIDADSTMKRLEPAMAAALARRFNGGQDQAAPPGGFDAAQMLDRLPAISLADLKPGEAIMLSTSDAADGPAIAFLLLAGVEPLLTASPSRARDMMSGWMSGGGGGEEPGIPQ